MVKQLLQTIRNCTKKSDKIKVGLEATGHYSYNILGFLLDNGLPTYVINPLHTNLYRKSLSLRKTKTDRVDARTIATMLLSDVDLKSYTDIAYHNEELKSLTRYRFDKVQERAKLKQSVSRLATILFPRIGRACFGIIPSHFNLRTSQRIFRCKANFRSPSYQADKPSYNSVQRTLRKRESHPDSRGSQSFYWLCHACQIFGIEAYH